MRISVLLVVSVIATQISVAQKPVIDTSVLDRWSEVTDGQISNDGKFAAYSIRTSAPHGSPAKISEVFASADGRWKKTFTRTDEDFSSRHYLLSDNKHGVVETSGDSLYLVRLGTDQKNYLGKAPFYTVFDIGDNDEWLALQESGESKKLILRRTSNGELKKIPDVSDCLFPQKAGNILLITRDNPKDDSKESIVFYNPVNGNKMLVWKGHNLQSFAADEAAGQVAFVTKENSGNAIWRWKTGMTDAQKCVTDSSAGINSNLEVAAEKPVFNKDGRYLFFQLSEKSIRQNPTVSKTVNIWNYQDIFLHDLQPTQSNRTFIAEVDLQSGRIFQLETADERLNLNLGIESLSSCEEHLIFTQRGLNEEHWWNPKGWPSVYVLSQNDQRRSLIKDRIPFINNDPRRDFLISPGDKYVVYFDAIVNDYFSYDISSGKTQNISRGVSSRWLRRTNQGQVPVQISTEGIAGWVNNESSVLVYDAFDIWKLDLSGNGTPVNVTRGYGNRHHLQLRLSIDVRDQNNYDSRATLLIRAFDTATKFNGYYKLSMIDGKEPTRLTLGPYFYTEALESKRPNCWLVRRECATECPNYFITVDWKSFRPISNYQPQKQYNWLTAEQFNWILQDGSFSQGILYKPENFDSAQRYPVLINYYEERSDGLYKFFMPGAMSGADLARNIPWFVSRGYVVLEADIHQGFDHPGDKAMDAIASATKKLRKNSWIDSTKIGVLGHSFGGWETNYIVSHSNIFTAAVSGAGVSDLISAYGEANGNRYYEIFQGRIGSTLWQRPDLYVENSPILTVDKITTPLLLLYNKEDYLVPFWQGLEFFTALRRLGKRTWMLQYDGEGHGLADYNNKVDFTIRITQFFDHYLKGAPAPKWMTQGIPAKRKGIETGYEPDTPDHEPQEQPVLYCGRIQLVRDAERNRQFASAFSSVGGFNALF